MICCLQNTYLVHIMSSVKKNIHQNILVYEKIIMNKKEKKKKDKILKTIQPKNINMSCIPTNWHICKHFSDLMWMRAPFTLFLFAD